MNCKNCGAPFNRLLEECEYCGTPYPKTFEEIARKEWIEKLRNDVEQLQIKANQQLQNRNIIHSICPTVNPINLSINPCWRTTPIMEDNFYGIK